MRGRPEGLGALGACYRAPRSVSSRFRLVVQNESTTRLAVLQSLVRRVDRRAHRWHDGPSMSFWSVYISKQRAACRLALIMGESQRGNEGRTDQMTVS